MDKLSLREDFISNRELLIYAKQYKTEEDLESLSNDIEDYFGKTLNDDQLDELAAIINKSQKYKKKKQTRKERFNIINDYIKAPKAKTPKAPTPKMTPPKPTKAPKMEAPEPTKIPKTEEPKPTTPKKAPVEKPVSPHQGQHHQDDSAVELQSALRNGYTNARFILNPNYDQGKDNGKCASLANSEYRIEDLMATLNYNAPLFELAHVGCLCSFEVYNPENASLQPYRIGAGNRWANINKGFKMEKIAMDLIPQEDYVNLGKKLKKLSLTKLKQIMNNFNAITSEIEDYIAYAKETDSQVEGRGINTIKGEEKKRVFDLIKYIDENYDIQIKSYWKFRDALGVLGDISDVINTVLEEKTIEQEKTKTKKQEKKKTEKSQTESFKKFEEQFGIYDKEKQKKYIDNSLKIYYILDSLNNNPDFSNKSVSDVYTADLQDLFAWFNIDVNDIGGTVSELKDYMRKMVDFASTSFHNKYPSEKVEGVEFEVVQDKVKKTKDKETDEFIQTRSKDGLKYDIKVMQSVVESLSQVINIPELQNMSLQDIYAKKFDDNTEKVKKELRGKFSDGGVNVTNKTDTPQEMLNKVQGVLDSTTSFFQKKYPDETLEKQSMISPREESLINYI